MSRNTVTYDKEYYQANKERIRARRLVSSRLYRAKNKDKLNDYCRSYMARPENTLKRNQRNALRKLRGRTYIANAKKFPCSDCGQSYPPYVMDFDHRGDKKFTIGEKPMLSLALLAAEIAKCDVVCSNCHRERTFGETVSD